MTPYPQAGGDFSSTIKAGYPQLGIPGGAQAARSIASIQAEGSLGMPAAPQLAHNRVDHDSRCIAPDYQTSVIRSQ
jgi:hypothetical protein